MRKSKERPDTLKSIKQRRGNPEMGEKDAYYYLCRATSDNSFWETRPLYEKDHMYYSGGPVEYVEVDLEYVKKYYGNDIT